jgi:hypothetical protein
MAMSELEAMSLIEEGNIDRDRIVDDHLVPDEYFCPICQYLLWKPRSCSSCQHLFCQKCIKMWIENTNSQNKCPFRCESFEERRCPPYVQSLLSRLNIHCRNSSFGCTAVVSYDALKHHESVECKYLTQKCTECEQLILQSKFTEHREFAGLCVPCPIKCTICQNYIEKLIFRDHFHGCCQEKINESLRRANPHETLVPIPTGATVTPHNAMAFFQSMMNTIQLFEQQKQLSRLPTTLKGVDAIRRAREQNCGHISHVFLMLKFVLLNWSKIPFLIFHLSTGGFVALGIVILGGYVLFCHWAYKHIYVGPFLILLLTFVSCYFSSISLQLVSDSTMIFSLGILFFLCGCLSRTSLELFEMNILFNKPILNIILCCVGIFIMKLILLLIRLFYWSMPTYLAAGLLTSINFYVGLNYANNIERPTNQPLMFV